MDERTLNAYNQKATTLAQKHQASVPERLYTLAKTFFIKNGATADIGSGIGRDTDWLIQNGYPTTGFEPSEGMRRIAREQYPRHSFKEMHLPAIETLENKFDNIFCSAVLMHIPRAELLSSAMSLLRALKSEGRMLLSFRHGQNENDGRLFEPYHAGQVAQLFESLGGKVILMEEDGVWKNLVIEKGDLS